LAEIFQAIDEKTGLVTYLRDAWDSVVLVFNQNLMPALQKLWESLQPFKPFLDALVVVFGTALVIAIGLVIKIIQGFIILSITMIEKWAEVVTWANKTLIPIFSAIGSAIASVVEWVNKLIEALTKLNFVKGVGAAISGAGSAIGRTLGINDGIVQNGKVITTHPDDYIIATKTPNSLLGGGGGINVNINGAIFSEDAARKLGDILYGQLQMQMKN
jgi:hypothetical protein